METYKIGEEVKLKRTNRPECKVFVRGSRNWCSVGFAHHIEVVTPDGEPNLVSYAQSVGNIEKIKREANEKSLLH